MRCFSRSASATFGARWAYRRTGDVSLVIGLVVLYFWTFLGAWPFIIGNEASKEYRISIGYYLRDGEDVPFKVVNMNYVLKPARLWVG